MSSNIARLQKEVLRVAGSFKDKNFREYFTRIAKDDFEKVVKTIPEEEFVRKQTENLEVLKRQAEIQNMYYSEDFAVKR